MSGASAQTAEAKATADAAPLIEKSHPSLTAALVKALAELTVIEKSRTADAGSYSYAYADLADIVSEVTPVLARHGLAMRTPIHGHGDGYAVTVKFLHESGETMDDEPLPFARGRDAQANGSGFSYYRRYAILAALNLATGDDDDGAKAVPAAPAPQPGFRQSLMAATEKLNDAEREHLRAWLAESGLPDRPSKMDEAQASRTVDWITNGLPKVES